MSDPAIPRGKGDEGVTESGGDDGVVTPDWDFELNPEFDVPPVREPFVIHEFELGKGTPPALITGHRDGFGGDGLFIIWLTLDRYRLSWHSYPDSERYAYARRAEELGVEPPFSPETAKPFWDAYARKFEAGGGELPEGFPL